MLTSIVGINWGDEGKGRMVDLLSRKYNVVVRYQGGNNAGHTVINDKGKFVLNLLPSGILRDETVNVMGPGMVIDAEHLFHEIQRLQTEGGIEITPDHLKISDKAVICMPYHKLLDCLEEDRLADKKFGSTRRGISPAYSDKYMKKALRMGDLRDREALRTHLADILEWKNLFVVNGYGHAPIELDEMMDWIDTYAMPFKNYVCDTHRYLMQAIEDNKSVLFEAQLGALRDIDYGIYPYTSGSSTIAAYAPIGSGIPGARLDNVIGIMKAYSSCVGEGPFTCELFGEAGDRLREAGGEYGAATGRPRRVGGFDVVASKYGVAMQGCDTIALTKLDVLSYMDRIPICVAYEIDGRRVTDFPIGVELDKAKPVYEYLPGFKSDISGCRKVEELPKEALQYVRYLESAVGCRIKYVSVGPDRDAYIKLF
ncbi:MAG: adenylosuccinate synthase [Oscillospiraceae bacterium]|nr:adenylosuccinate synthase [Oscillospiraceae bacterium]